MNGDETNAGLPVKIEDIKCEPDPIVDYFESENHLPDEHNLINIKNEIKIERDEGNSSNATVEALNNLNEDCSQDERRDIFDKISDVIVNMPIRPRLNDIKDRASRADRGPGGRITCCFCKISFENKIRLHNHTCYKQKTDAYSCSVCHRGYARKSSLTNHMKIHRYAPGRQIFGSSTEPSDENDADTISEFEHIKCEPGIANYVYDSYDPDEKDESDEEEGQNETGANFVFVKTEIPDISIENSSTASNAENDVLHECQFCKTKYATSATLQDHIMLCDKNFPSPGRVLRLEILKRKRSDSEENVCCLCFTKFNDKIQLHNHKCGKTSANVYHCNICQRQFSRKTCLVNHQKIHRYIPGRALIKQEFVT